MIEHFIYLFFLIKGFAYSYSNGVARRHDRICGFLLDNKLCVRRTNSDTSLKALKHQPQMCINALNLMTLLVKSLVFIESELDSN